MIDDIQSAFRKMVGLWMFCMFFGRNRLKLNLSKDGWFAAYGEYNITKPKRSILIWL